jgi:cytochrome subunit of sulfide dehydrogenase
MHRGGGERSRRPSPIRLMMPMRIPVVAAIVLASIATALAASPEPPAGAASCTGCHAVNAGVESPIPRLVGRNAAEMAAQMQAFKTGRQPSTVMDRIAKGFSDAEIEAIAAWYAQQN